jgi:phenylacetate-CoA ligase
VSGSSPPRPSRVEFRYLLSQVWGEPRDVKLSADEMAARRDERVRAIVRFAYEQVPWYARTMRELGIVPADVEVADDLAILPVVEHEDRGPRSRSSFPRSSSARPMGRCCPTSGVTADPTSGAGARPRRAVAGPPR